MDFNVIVSSETAISEVALAVLTAMLLENDQLQAQFVLQAPEDSWSSALGFALKPGSKGVMTEAFEHAITRANFVIFRCPVTVPQQTVQTWTEHCARQDPALPFVVSKFEQVVRELRAHFADPAFAAHLVEARVS